MELVLKQPCERPEKWEQYLPRFEWRPSSNSNQIDDVRPYFHRNGAIDWLGTESPDVLVVERQEENESVFANAELCTVITLNFLAEAADHMQAANAKLALRSIYRNCRLLMSLGMLQEIDDEISATTLQELDSDLLLGLLTATLPRKTELKSRDRLFAECKRLLKRRGHYERGIMDGLD